MADREQSIIFKDRIKEFRRIKASELLDNKDNWRVHPEAQRKLLSRVLSDIGFADALVVRIVDNKYELLDGHLRKDIAREQEVPVLIVDLNDKEAALFLASFDTSTGMADADCEIYASLIASIEDDYYDIVEMIESPLGNMAFDDMGIADDDEDDSNDLLCHNGMMHIDIEFIPEDYESFIRVMNAIKINYNTPVKATIYGIKMGMLMKRVIDENITC